MSHYETISPAIEARFHAGYAKGSRMDDCWEWSRAKTRSGYGVLNDHGTLLYTHRIAWRLHSGAAPDPLHVLHRCDNPCCCNPAHLFLGTPKDNCDDKMAKGREGKRGTLLGAAHHQAKLTESLVLEIRQSSEPARVVARRLGVTPENIRAVRNRVTWKHVA